MSVFSLVASWNGSQPNSVELQSLQGFLQKWGPGGVATLEDNGCWLGVGILDAGANSEKSRTLRSECGISAVLDGRLDRSTDLRRDLGMGEEASDISVVVQGFLKLGAEETLGRMRGPFAVAVWDSRLRRLIIGRDTFSIRPAYYARGGNWIAVASDPEQLLNAGFAGSRVDPGVVRDYLLWDGRFTDRTFFADIRALPGGHLLEATERAVTVRRYKSPSLRLRRYSSRQDCWDGFCDAFTEAVTSAVRSPGHVVAELSGGLDSSSIVCVADALARAGTLPALSVSAAAGTYPGLSCDETPYIDAVAHHIQLPVDRWDGTKGGANDFGCSSISAPGARTITFAGVDGQVALAAARDSHIIISGLCGDQIGVSSGSIEDAVREYRFADALGMIRKAPGATPRSAVQRIFAVARSFVPEQVRRVGGVFRRWPAPDWINTPSPTERPRVCVPDELQSEVHRRIWRSLNGGRHAVLMTYAQQPSIRAHVEMRFPFLDVDLMAVVLSIPAKFWPPPWPFERLHRDILSPYLPPAVAHRKSKAHFQPAVTLRVHRQIAEIHELFRGATWEAAEFVSQSRARQLLTRYIQQKTPAFSDTFAIWAIATLEAWQRAISRYPTRRARRDYV